MKTHSGRDPPNDRGLYKFFGGAAGQADLIRIAMQTAATVSRKREKT